MRPTSLILIATTPFLLGGCLASAAVNLATAPVRVASRAVDLATTSQSEADETRGREIRRREETVGSLERDYELLADDCENGNEGACREAIAVRREIDAILPTLPVETER